MLRKGIIASPASTVRTWTKERHRRASVDVTIVELLRKDEIGLRKSISSLITIHRECQVKNLEYVSNANELDD